MESVHELVSQVLHSKGAERIQSAARLAKHVNNLTPAQRELITRAEIDELSSLLDDESSPVQYYAAESLGSLGPKASTAVPALRKAIEKIEADESKRLVQPSLSGSYPAYEALHKITGEPIPEKVR